MTFIRVKRISGKEYAYLVTNSWTGSGPRQKVAKYLGRVIRPVKTKSENLGAFLGHTGQQQLQAWISKSSFKEIAAALLNLEMANHSLEGHKIDIENARLLDEKDKEIVLALNEGFLCSHTAKKLLEYDASSDYSGYNLADSLTAAGIAVDKDVFISLFGKAQGMASKEEKGGNKDFYY